MRDLLLVDQDVGVFELALHLLRVGDEVRRQVAAVELHALDELVVRSRCVLPSSTVMTPSLPTLSIASAMILPISASLLAATVATFSRSFLFLTSMLHLLELGDDVLDGLLDAALHEHRVGAGDDGPQAFVEDGLGQHGGGGGAVAGHVAGLAGDLLDHAGAHVLVLVFQLDLLGDGDAVLGDGRASRRTSG